MMKRLPRSEDLSLPALRRAYPEIGMANFSFNKPAGACPTCTGLGSVQQANLERLVDRSKSVSGGRRRWAGTPFYITLPHATSCRQPVLHYGFQLRPRPAGQGASPRRSATCCSMGWKARSFRRHFPGSSRQPPSARGRFEGMATNLLRRYAEHIHDPGATAKSWSEFLVTETCPDCAGHSPAPRKPRRDRGGLERSSPSPACRSASWRTGWAACPAA